VVYGHPDFGDERVLLRFAFDGTAQIAQQDVEGVRPWSPLTGWTAERRELRFTDPRTGRRFDAHLERPTLGGGWRTLTTVGGWWCTRIDAAIVPEPGEKEKSTKLWPPLVARLTATPRYPVKAIRAAKQGRAVTCFFVDAEGYVVQPEVIELSDEVFREPILDALERSRYDGWADTSVLRPGCRSYIFRLDEIQALE
jgi:hypothetical protein